MYFYRHGSLCSGFQTVIEGSHGADPIYSTNLGSGPLSLHALRIEYWLYVSVLTKCRQQDPLHNLSASLVSLVNKLLKIGIPHWGQPDYRAVSLVCLQKFRKKPVSLVLSLRSSRREGNNNTWAFGGANTTNGAPGLPSLQGRQLGTSSSSFAQTIGGSQPATPLDMS